MCRSRVEITRTAKCAIAVLDPFAFEPPVRLCHRQLLPIRMDCESPRVRARHGGGQSRIRAVSVRRRGSFGRVARRRSSAAQRAETTSVARLAVRMRSSSARRASPSCFRSLAMRAPISRNGSARCCLTCFFLPGAGRSSLRRPRQRAVPPRCDDRHTCSVQHALAIQASSGLRFFRARAVRAPSAARGNSRGNSRVLMQRNCDASID